MTILNSVDQWLSYTLPANAFIDFLRVVEVVLGINLAVFSALRIFQRVRLWSAVGYIVFGFCASLQEAEQISHPFLPWRLPLLLIGTLAGLKYMSYTLAQVQNGPSIRRKEI